MIRRIPAGDVLSEASTEILDEAIDSICELYRADLQRKPSKFEIRDLFEFVLAPRDDLPDTEQEDTSEHEQIP